MPRRFPFILLALVLGATGCSRRIQSPLPAASLTPPPQWSAGDLTPPASEEDPEEPPVENWWDAFDDAGLAQAIQTALENSHDLEAAAARIDTARAEAVIARAPQLPELDASLSLGRQRQNFVGLPIPGREDSVLSSTSTSARLQLGASWEPDLWGRVRAGSMASLRNVEVRQAELAGLRLSMSGQVAIAWFSAVEASRQTALARATLDNFKTSAERIRVRFEAGVRSSLDLRLALAEAARAEASLELRTEQLACAVRRLETLLGAYPGGRYAIGDDLPGPADGIPGHLPSELVHRRPDIFAAERRALAAGLQTTQARAGLRPRFSLTSATGTASDELRDLLDGDFFIWSLAGNLLQPVFNRGRLRATVERNEALAREMFANYENVILQAYGEVESALAAEAILKRRQQALAEAVRQAVAARELAGQRYRSGLADIITVLSAQRTAFESESQLLAVRRLRLENCIQLHLALGGGFDASDIPPAGVAIAQKPDRENPS